MTIRHLRPVSLAERAPSRLHADGPPGNPREGTDVRTQRQEVHERAAIDQLEAELEGLMLEMHAILSGDPWRKRYEPWERGVRAHRPLA